MAARPDGTEDTLAVPKSAKASAPLPPFSAWPVLGIAAVTLGVLMLVAGRHGHPGMSSTTTTGCGALRTAFRGRRNVKRSLVLLGMGCVLVGVAWGVTFFVHGG